jgi:inner membrane protein
MITPRRPSRRSLPVDPVSQAALGAVVARSVSHRQLGAGAVALGAAAGAMPDIDVFFSLDGNYFDQLVSHRGITHSLFFAPIVGPVIGWLAWRWTARRRNEPGHPAALRAWMLAMTLAILSHPLLDYLTPYGTQLLQPFSDARFAVAAMPIIDPIYTLLLLAGLFVGYRFRAAGGRIATATLLISCAYLGYGWHLNEGAERIARAQLAAQGLADVEVAAFPTILQIHHRRVVARTPDTDRVGFLSMWNPCEIGWQSAPRLPRSEIDTFISTREGAIFDWFTMGWSHYAIDNGRITATDLRYGSDENPRASVFTASAALDRLGRPTGQVAGGRFNPDANGDNLERLIAMTYAPGCRTTTRQIAQAGIAAGAD